MAGWANFGKVARFRPESFVGSSPTPATTSPWANFGKVAGLKIQSFAGSSPAGDTR